MRVLKFVAALSAKLNISKTRGRRHEAYAVRRTGVPCAHDGLGQRHENGLGHQSRVIECGEAVVDFAPSRARSTHCERPARVGFGLEKLCTPCRATSSAKRYEVRPRPRDRERGGRLGRCQVLLVAPDTARNSTFDGKITYTTLVVYNRGVDSLTWAVKVPLPPSSTGQSGTRGCLRVSPNHGVLAAGESVTILWYVKQQYHSQRRSRSLLRRERAR